MINLINIIQPIYNDYPLNEENVQQILNLEAFREHPELQPSHLEQLVDLCEGYQKKVQIITSIINHASANEKTHFSKLVDGQQLIEFASKDKTLAEYIFSNAFCLDLFRKDIKSFPIYFLKLCQNQTDFAYNLIRKFKDNDNMLFDSLKNCSDHRSVHSQILSYYDNLSRDTENSIGFYIHHEFADQLNLITGHDAKNNFLVITRSKKRAKNLLENIFFLNDKDQFTDISFSEIIDVVKMHNELSCLVIERLSGRMNHLEKNREKANYSDASNETLHRIQTLLPFLENSANNGDKSSKLILAELLFKGITSKGQQIDDAVSLCKEILENSNSENFYLGGVYDLLLKCADAYSYGVGYEENKIKKDSGAIALYQFLANRASNDDHKSSLYLDIAKKCMENNLHSFAANLLLFINKEAYDPDYYEYYTHISFELAVKLISQDDFNQGASLLQSIPFINQSLTQQNSQEIKQLSRIAGIQNLLHYYTNAFNAVKESLQTKMFCEEKNDIKDCQNTLYELGKMIKHLDQEFFSRLKETYYNLPKFWTEDLPIHLPATLKQEIVLKYKLKNTLKTIDSTQYSDSVKGLQRFYFKAENKSPATKWTKNDNKWQKVTDDVTNHQQSISFSK
jgi:hypothetical protein